MGPNPVSLDYNPYKRKHNTVRSCEDEGRDQGDASINQEHRRLPANYQKPYIFGLFIFAPSFGGFKDIWL